ncbi:MAG: membrane protein insertion efficiency factor YidD [Pelagibacterales bacterium]|jgi:putative membrane protein insertion efficiency factor|nr:membrane protein insertion efficiency factor YidD [Pelagibacterales bacterium]
MKKINIKKLVKYFIRLYQLIISPYLGNNCRFYPTCSNYAIEAIEKKGLIVGIVMAVKRILRCNPWGGSGIDMVCEKDVKNKN